MSRFLVLLSLCAITRCGWAVSYSGTDFGGSPVPIGAGARALGMGGAFTAVADDASASTWNPAGMAQLERAEAGATLGYYRAWTDPAGDGTHSTDDLDLDHLSLVQPFFAFGFQQTFGLSWQRQFDFTRSYAISQHTAAQTALLLDRTSTDDVDQEGAYSSLSASYAIEIAPGFAIGATGRIWNDDWSANSSYSQHLVTNSRTTLSLGPIVLNDSADHIDETTTNTVREGYSGVVGAWWQASPNLAFGLTYKPKYRLRLHVDRHTTQVTEDLVSNIANASETDESSRFEFHQPSSATAGVAWRYRDRQTVAVDVTWTRWREMFTDQDGDTRSPINPFIEPSDFADGWSVRLGYEHIFILSRLVAVARCGGFWEQVPGMAPTPNTIDTDQTHAINEDFYGATTGMSFCQRHAIYDLGAQLRFGDDVGAGQDASPDQTVDHLSLVVRGGLTWQF